LWDVASGQLLRTFTYQNPIRSVAFSPDGRWLASCSDIDSVQLWGMTN